MTSAPSTPSRRRAVLLDFDGTYADHAQVPAEHVEAVRAARRAGHAVLLCTGRCEGILNPDVTRELDGVISSAGARIRIGDDLLRDKRVEPDLARRSLAALAAHDALFVLESPIGLHCSPEAVPLLAERLGETLRAVWSSEADLTGDDAEERLQERSRRAVQDILDAVQVEEDLSAVPFAKIVVWSSPVPVDAIAAEIGPDVVPLPNSVSDTGLNSGELQPADVDKADAVPVVAEHLGIDVADVVGAGDGMNDVGMLKAAGVAVGIEGSRPEVLAEADIVVPGPGEHGLVQAFERLGLI